MKMRQCKVDGCFALVSTDVGYCERHAYVATQRKAQAAEGAALRWDAHHTKTGGGWVYRGARWREIRDAQLLRQPRCAMCGEEGTQVDHITPHRGDESLAFDLGNLQTLCRRCHARKSRGDR
jgi:5-methylcytosine-specific restriction protein A